jgi:hypothetical protein
LRLAVRLLQGLPLLGCLAMYRSETRFTRSPVVDRQGYDDDEVGNVRSRCSPTLSRTVTGTVTVTVCR